MVADRNYLALFVAESGDQLEKLSSELVALEQMREAVPSVLWDSIFRRIHSIKGSAGTLELTELVGITHAAEELIARLRARPQGPARTAIDLLLETSDALTRLLSVSRRALDEGAGDALPTRAPLVQLDVAGLMLRIERMTGELPVFVKPVRMTSSPGQANTMPEPGPEVPRYTLRVHLSPRCAAPGARAMILQRKLKTFSYVASIDPAPALLAQSRTPHLITVRIATTKEPLELRAACKGLPEVDFVDVLDAKGEPALPPEERPDAKTIAPPEQSVPPPITTPLPPTGLQGNPLEPNKDATVRVRTEALDQLLDAAGEVLGGIARLREAARKLPEQVAPAFEAEVDRLRRLVRELHGKVVSARLTPFSTLTERLPRAIRDLAHRLGKEVDFEIHGADVELDRAIIDAMGNPLSHLVRNAIDHGIERPDDRLALGKPGRGKLSLRARREKDCVFVEVSDDGRGIDGNSLKRKAVESGAIAQAMADVMTDAQALELAFLPGISTRNAATEVSGRGVGLDAVVRSIEALGGKMTVQSTLGQGAAFTFELPRSVAMANLLLVQVGGEIYGLPVQRVLVTIEYDLSSRGGEGFESRSVIVAGQLVRAYPLAQLFGLPSLAPPGVRPFVVLEVDGTTFALAVDRLVGQEEAVVRPLYPPLDRMRGLAGTCVLSNGRPLLVLDPRGLFEMTGVPRTHVKGAP